MHEIELQAVDSPSAFVAGQAQQYLNSDGESVDHPEADRLILLYVKGRKTGTIRRVPLVAVEDGGDLIIIGSKAGAPEHPAWYRNLAADPRVWVRRKKDFFEAHATTLVGDERTRAWEMVIDVMPFFDSYRKKTDRTLPVIRLARAG